VSGAMRVRMCLYHPKIDRLGERSPGVVDRSRRGLHYIELADEPLKSTYKKHSDLRKCYIKHSNVEN